MRDQTNAHAELDRMIYLREGGACLALETPEAGLPRILYWGRDLGELDADELGDLARLTEPRRARGFLDAPTVVSVLPEASNGWQGRPGLEGDRDGRAWSTRLVVRSLDVIEGPESPDCVAEVRCRATDEAAGLEVAWTLQMLRGGAARQRARVANLDEARYRLDHLDLAVPVPARCDELLDFAGRWSKERVPQRQPWNVGTHLREARRGRPGADSATLLVAGPSGFDFARGQVWAVHEAWSGDHRTYAESTASGERTLAGGELLGPGEVVLARGEAYTSPWLYFAWGDGLDDLASRFHRYLRARPEHPRSPRPVTLNVWQAVYFDQNRGKLRALAQAAHEIGVERFVLDDGWFAGRRDDTAGLGDWFVDPQVWPGDSLAGFSRAVRESGMEFGLWFEPEMVNPDSDLFRAHPDWVLRPEGRLPMTGRHQQVLNLTVPEAWDHLLERIVTLVRGIGVDYIKWDHNRDLVEAGDAASGRPAVHGQTLALYRLIDAVREQCPGLEIESCASGGARVDLEILQRTQRVWASDCIDAIERQDIQRWTSQLIPLEMIGAHVEAGRSHTTGRRLPLPLRAATALFGHFGIEWDITEISQEERRALAGWIRVYKEHRALLHSGRLVRRDAGWLGGALWGVVSEDGAEALYALDVLTRTPASPVGALALPGLDPEARYSVRRIAAPAGGADEDAFARPRWWDGQCRASGRMLGEAGLPLPQFEVEAAVLLEVRRISPAGPPSSCGG
jgi:alpha-galactosidase